MKKGILFLLLGHLVLSGPTSAQVYLSPGLQCTLHGDISIALRDLDLVNNGIFEQDGGTLQFSGFTNSYISGSASTHILRLQIAKSGNSLLQLQRPITIDSQVIFVSGLIDLNGFDMTLEPSAFLKDETEISRIVGSNGGRVTTSLFLNAPMSVNVGNLGAEITSDKNLGNVTISRGHQPQQLDAGGNMSIRRYYQISATLGLNLKSTLRFKYFDAELNGLDEFDLNLWENKQGKWTDRGYSSRSAADNYVEKKNLSALFTYTLAPDLISPITNAAIIPGGLYSEQYNNKSFRIFPNPASNYLNIEWSAKTSASTSISIKDVEGRVIKKVQAGFIQQNTMNRKTISLEGLTKGVYILELRTGADIQVSKFVIQ